MRCAMNAEKAQEIFGSISTNVAEKSQSLVAFTLNTSTGIKATAEKLKASFDRLEEKQKYVVILGAGLVTISVLGLITSTSSSTRRDNSNKHEFSFSPSPSSPSKSVSFPDTSHNSTSSPSAPTISSSSSPQKSWFSLGSWGGEVPHECTVSAPGKILIAGGYLILQSPNLGVVVSCTARFFTTVKGLPMNTKPISGTSIIMVESPQFHQSFDFEYSLASHTLILKSKTPNKFVEKCLFVVLAYVKEHLGEEAFGSTLKTISSQKQAIGIKLRADNDFYSHIKKLKLEKKPLLSSSLQDLPAFLPCPTKEDGTVDVSKTGMGSSAAMTASLVGALLNFFDVVNLRNGQTEENSDKDKTLIHNLGQIAHSVAQEKCGSGFDVSAAVYGSQKYVRFEAEGIKSCLEPSVTSKMIYDVANSKEAWNQDVTPFNLPPGMFLLMGDICGGSSSTSMAKNVLQWLKEKPMQSASVWAALSDANKLIYEGLVKLNAIAMENPEKYAISLNKASKLTADKWSQEVDEVGVFSALQNIRKLFKRTRFWLKRMGDNAGVSIEPDASSALADRTESLAGVLCSGVPGAGGYDALYTIALSREARDNVERVWSGWEASMRGRTYGTTVCPLTLEAETSDGDKYGIAFENDIKW